MKIGQAVRHYKNGIHYVVTDRCLIQEDGIWKDAIIYSKVGGDLKFCRELNEFNLKFKIF